MILAADTYGRWGGLFSFSLAEDGDWFCDCVSAQRDLAGAWEELGSGGSRGGPWDIPWRPPDEGWGGDPVLVMMVAGLTVFDDDEMELNLRVVGGFVSSSVKGFLVITDGHKRHVPVMSPVGAFAVASVTRQEGSLTPLGPDGARIGRARRIV
jgi:hypothetical protein